MDPFKQRVSSPNIRRVLQRFQSHASRRLSGPASSPVAEPLTWSTSTNMSTFQSPQVLDLSKRYSRASTYTKKFKVEGVTDMEHYNAMRVALPINIQPPPFFSTMDMTRCDKSETQLEGETISCFIVGGEKRLCLPQILHTVLREYTLPQIDSVCDDLHIFCSRCNDEQLRILKTSRILPITAQSCGLVTKTDAERLCHVLIFKNSKKLYERRKPSQTSFYVYHECFGKCTGTFFPELYALPDAKCIVCSDCVVAFSPNKFVCHTHKSLENRTCHWGFDSTNWRCYLMLARGQPNIGKLQEVLEQLKARFDHDRTYKRRQSPDIQKSDQKRSKHEETAGGSKRSTLSSNGRIVSSAFRPWSPGSMKDGKVLPQSRDSYAQVIPSYLHTGPPVLLNPERVVRHSEYDRYEQHFAPNVSLAPMEPQKSKDKMGEDTSQLSDSLDLLCQDTFSPSSSLNSHLSSPNSDKTQDDIVLIESSLERELELVRRVLSRCDIHSDSELGEKSFQEFSLLRARHEEQWNKAIRVQAKLQKDVEMLHKELAEVTLTHRQTLHELKRLQSEMEKKQAEEQEHRERLVGEIDSLQKEKEKMCVKVKVESDTSMQDMEAICTNLQQEVLWYRQELAHYQADYKISPVKKVPVTNGMVVSTDWQQESPSTSTLSPQSTSEQAASSSACVADA